MKIRLTPLKNAINSILKPLNLRLDTLTQRNIELKKLNSLRKNGHFETDINQSCEIKDEKLEKLLVDKGYVIKHIERNSGEIDSKENFLASLYKN